MKKRKRIIYRNVLFIAMILAIGCNSTKNNIGKLTSEKYEENWESLKTHQIPDWFKDAKFGIYTHWGPITYANLEVGSGWYGRRMYEDSVSYNWKNEMKAEEPHRTYLHHVKKWGDPSEIGYKDLIPKFQPDKFNAEEWAELFKKAGAQFAGPVAMHHDNFAMWDSEVTWWNIKKTAGIDVTGELEKAIKKRGMKFLTSFHHSYSWRYYELSYKFDGKTPGYEDLYCEPHEMGAPLSDKFCQSWYDKLEEVMLKYQPDFIWFDFGLEEIPENYRQKFLARYFNLAQEWGKEVGVSYKIKKYAPLPPEACVLDFERGRASTILERQWLTDTSPGPWFYNKNAKFKSTNSMIDMLVDIVSKRGCLLLNIPPKEDGTIPQEVQKLLLEMGKWLEVNGDAIYGTRVWDTYGEGPTRFEGSGDFVEKKEITYTAEDIRFTKKDGKLYAIALDWPETELKINSLGKNSEYLKKEIKSIKLIGVDGNSEWDQTNEALVINTQGVTPTCEYAFVWEIRFEN